MPTMDHALLIPGYREAGGGVFVQSGVQQFLYSGQTPYTRRITSQSYVADKSSSGDYRNTPQLGRCYSFDGVDDAIEWITADVGTLYISYYNVTGAAWVDSTMTYSTTKYVFSPGAIKVHNFKVWTDNLASTAEKQATSGIPSNMWAWLKCDDTHSTTAYDSSGNARHGTKVAITAGTFHSSDSGVLYSWQNRVGYTDDVTNGLVPRDESATTLDVTGAALEYTGRTHYDGALGGLPGMTFNGTSEYLSGTHPFSGALADFTMCCWFYVNAALVGYRMLISSDETGLETELRLNGNKLEGIVTQTPGPTYIIVKGVTGLVNYVWYHGAVVCDSGSFLKVFLNAAQDASNPPGPSNVTWGTNVYVGARPGGSFGFGGAIFDVRFYNAALDASQLAEVMAGGQPTGATPAQQYPLCEGSGTTCYSTEGNTLTLTSAAPTTVHATKNTINDHLIRYGGRLDSGVYIPGDLDGLLAANGAALTFGPGVLPNDGSFVNRKPAAYPLLNDVETSHGALNTSEEVGDVTTSPNLATDSASVRHSLNTPEP